MMRHTALLVSAFVVALDASAQIGPPAASPQGSQATPLPISGRNQQTGSVTAVQAPVAGTVTSVNTINPSIQVQGAYTGSTTSTAAMPFSGRLSLEEAIERGLEFNLGPVGLNDFLQQARGLNKFSRSALLPNITGTVAGAVQQINLRAAGLRFSTPVPGLSFPSLVGPFNYTDFRARLTQTLIDLTALNNYRSAEQIVRANEFSLEDARDLTVLAVGGAYLQVLAATARIEAARAQLETANALYRQAAQQRAVGVVAQIDVNRSQVQMLIQRQRLATLQNDLSKQKINLARMIGLPPNDQFDLTNDVPFAGPPALTIEAALTQAFELRADLKAAQAQVQAAERTLAAARSERLPSLSLSADYGVIGANPAQLQPTFLVAGTVRIPIWQGGRTEGNIEQAEAALSQRKAELSDVRDRIESEVRNAYLDLQAAGAQVGIAQQNVQVSEETLSLSRQRFEAGIADNVAVVQSQEGMAGAQLDYINSVFSHNLAKLSLARAIGHAAQSWRQFLSVK
jgi:outer membrane protein TolC